MPLPSGKLTQMASIEIPLPDDVMTSLPDIGGVAVATDALVKEITVPLTLSEDELRRHRKLRLKITLDVTID